MHKQTIAPPGAFPAAMRRAGRPIAVLTVLERRVVGLLRSACSGARAAPRSKGASHNETSSQNLADARLVSSLGRLAAEVRNNGLNVFGPSSTFVSDDELAILSWLSMLQRPSQSSLWRMANPFQEATRAFAELLLEDKRRLPARSMLADAQLEREGCFHIELRSEAASKRVSDTVSSAQSAEARAVALVEGNRFATASQFRALGISTQKLSRLCRRGYVERVSLGLYKKPEATAAMFAS